ncbi:putative vacuolar calcium ion transporter [Mollisia scopiformis]|uniref:Vacuolar calcium ion transporter n=1 Tax=Mollisia scopiformis TaxID=149040 RepID=A0A194XAI6_MOLSC|nr:putative vacuolar calcium ion transporter [Mollisia scopiformis]KUJ16772.1 putative vacuolar calcium ion transporter [Mollisia scopiformis]
MGPGKSRTHSRTEDVDNSTQSILPTHDIHNTERPLRELIRTTTGIQPAGESGRKGIHPYYFFRICWRSTNRASRLCNILWPVVPAAIAVKYARHDLHLAIFILNYIAMVPCANLIGFAGQEMGRKLHKVFGVLLETTLGSVVEIVMFMVLVKNDQFQVIKAAILGSVLATQLLCLGLCFFVGGIRHNELEFNEAVGEVGSDLLLTAGFGLIVPAAFHTAVTANSSITTGDVAGRVLHISRITAILLIIAYAVYTYFQIRTHESIYDAIFEEDENKDHDAHKGEHVKPKLTFTECILALVISITLVTIIAISLVEEIEFIVRDRGVSDSFVGLILVPLVEKFAEHLTAIDEAWDNQMNMALAHVLGATVQTSLFNGPLVVLVGWGLNKSMDLNFDLFNIIVLILAILVVGNFLRDQKSNYLEGSLCVIVYINIAVAAFYYPNPDQESSAISAAAVTAKRLLGLS